MWTPTGKFRILIHKTAEKLELILLISNINIILSLVKSVISSIIHSVDLYASFLVVMCMPYRFFFCFHDFHTSHTRHKAIYDKIQPKHSKRKAIRKATWKSNYYSTQHIPEHNFSLYLLCVLYRYILSLYDMMMWSCRVLCCGGKRKGKPNLKSFMTTIYIWANNK